MSATRIAREKARPVAEADEDLAKSGWLALQSRPRRSPRITAAYGPPGESPPAAAYLDRYVGMCRRRLPQFAAGTTGWWLEPRPFFGGLVRERAWVFWRRVLHTGHHRTQVQTWLRLAGVTPVPAIYGPSGDVTWDEADPTYSLAAANRAAT